MDSRTAEGGIVLLMQNSAGSGREFASDILKIPQQRGDVFVVSRCNARSHLE